MRSEVLVDPCTLARFADSRSLDPFEALDGEDCDPEAEPSVRTWTSLTTRLPLLLARLTEPEREVLTLCRLQGKQQKQAAAILGIPASTVQRRVDRAVERLRFWAKLPLWTPEELRKRLQGVLSPRDRELAVALWEHASARSVARALDRTQGGVEAALCRILVRLAAERRTLDIAAALSTVYARAPRQKATAE